MSDTSAVPNPGTDAAISQGCTCPVMDNCHGRGYHGRAGMFVYTWGCPVHSPTETHRNAVNEAGKAEVIGNEK